VLCQCVSTLCVHKEKCNTCGVTGHLYGTQAPHPGRWKLNNKGRLVRKPNKQPLTKEDFVCTLITDLSIQSMVDNSVSVSTTAAEEAHTRRVATWQLHDNTNAERLDINETVRVMEGLGSNAAPLQEENKATFKTLYSYVHLGAVAVNRLAASAAESSLKETTQPSSDVDGQRTSDKNAAAAAEGDRGGRGRGRKRGVGDGSGRGRRRGGGDDGAHGSRHAASSGKKARCGGASGQAHKEEHAVKAERVNHTRRRSRTDRYAAAITKSKLPSSASLPLRQVTGVKKRPAGAATVPHPRLPSMWATSKAPTCQLVKTTGDRKRHAPASSASCPSSCLLRSGANLPSALRMTSLRSCTSALSRTWTRKWRAWSSRARLPRKCGSSCLHPEPSALRKSRSRFALHFPPLYAQQRCRAWLMPCSA